LYKVAKLDSAKWESFRHAGETILALTGKHTLAIIQEGVYASKDTANWERYPEMFHKYRRKLLSLLTVHQSSQHLDVYTTFEVSAQTLQALGTEEARDAILMLGMMSMLVQPVNTSTIFEQAASIFPEVQSRGAEEHGIDSTSRDLLNYVPEVITDGSELCLQAALFCLSSYSLITVLGDDMTRIAMHPLILSWVGDRLDTSDRDLHWLMAGSVLALLISSVRGGKFDHDIRLAQVISYTKVEHSDSLPALVADQIDYHCAYLIGSQSQSSVLDKYVARIFRQRLQNMDAVTERKYIPFYELRALNLLSLNMQLEAISL